jgi:hypothetical protein
MLQSYCIGEMRKRVKSGRLAEQKILILFSSKKEWESLFSHSVRLVLSQMDFGTHLAITLAALGVSSSRTCI